MSSVDSQTHVLIFLKAPRPGYVKTRLAKDVGDESACEIYKRLVEHTLQQIPDELHVTIHFSPADALPEFHEWLGKGYDYQPQPELDLGGRMSHACDLAFQEKNTHDNARQVILLGGDCPAISSAHLVQMHHLLRRGLQVIGPTKDGGYWTLGLTQSQPELFLDMEWSTSTVFSETTQRLAQASTPFQSLETLEDVDYLEDWNRQKHHLNRP